MRYLGWEPFQEALYGLRLRFALGLVVNFGISLPIETHRLIVSCRLQLQLANPAATAQPPRSVTGLKSASLPSSLVGNSFEAQAEDGHDMETVT
jgi:hypothetical protein